MQDHLGRADVAGFDLAPKGDHRRRIGLAEVADHAVDDALERFNQIVAGW